MASIYIHIPFCRHKCIYCDFYSVVPPEPGKGHGSIWEDFLNALEKEIGLRGSESRFKKEIETIFFGGGTPSILDPSMIEKVLNLLSSRFSIRADAEITLEANPGTVNRTKLSAFRSAGINRISLGIQSFHDDDLKFLTRIHTSADAKQCIKDIYETGFNNVSFDLIFSLPGQTIDRWKSNLEQAIGFEPSHISCYSLIVEPDTPLFHKIRSKEVIPVEADRDAELYKFTIDHLGSFGYSQYEVSNFARENRKCRHNIAYWNHTDYLGFGPSAHSFWKNERWWNISDISLYIGKLTEGSYPLSGGEHLTEDQLAEESVFLGLRSEGIDLQLYNIRFKKDFFKENVKTINRLVQEGYARLDNGRFSLTSKGYVICDEISQSF